MALFHYAINPGGYLFLGTSESTGEFADLFLPLDRKARIYQRKGDAPVRRAGRFPLTSPFPPALYSGRASPEPYSSPREVIEKALLDLLAPAAALVNAQGDILYLHGRTGNYLEPASGDATVSNIHRMARQGLGPELGLALHIACLLYTSRCV